MTDSLVSVVIPCFNAERWIGEAIESALTQTWSAVEVVVVDDGSSDNSIDVIDGFDARVRWETGPNKGACAARNRGLAIARGNLIQFLDADDLLLPDKLKRQVPHAMHCGLNKLSFTLGRTENGDSFFDWQSSRILHSGRDALAFVLGGALQICAPLHHRKNLEAIGGFDESLKCSQEFDLHLRLVSAGLGLAQIQESHFVVRRQPGSISSDGLGVLLQRAPILRSVVATLSDTNMLTAERKAALAQSMATAASKLRHAGISDQADELLADASELVADPELLMWTDKWRPLARLVGSQRLARMRAQLIRVRKNRWPRSKR